MLEAAELFDVVFFFVCFMSLVGVTALVPLLPLLDLEALVGEALTNFCFLVELVSVAAVAAAFLAIVILFVVLLRIHGVPLFSLELDDTRKILSLSLLLVGCWLDGECKIAPSISRVY